MSRSEYGFICVPVCLRWRVSQPVWHFSGLLLAEPQPSSSKLGPRSSPLLLCLLTQHCWTAGRADTDGLGMARNCGCVPGLLHCSRSWLIMSYSCGFTSSRDGFFFHFVRCYEMSCGKDGLEHTLLSKLGLRVFSVCLSWGCSTEPSGKPPQCILHVVLASVISRLQAGTNT